MRLAGGVDREGRGEGPLVVLLHGFGASGDDLVPLWRVMDVPREVRWAFPAGPLELPSMGYGMESRAWWRIDLAALERSIQSGRARDLSGDHPPGLPEARAKVVAMLDALERELAPSAMVLGGFSQGAMLALDVALHTDRPLAGLVLMSGTLLAQDAWVPRMPLRRGLRVVQSHGEADALLSFAHAERLRDHLVGAGLDLTWVPFRGGHEIPGPVLDEVGLLVRRVATSARGSSESP